MEQFGWPPGLKVHPSPLAIRLSAQYRWYARVRYAPWCAADDRSVSVAVGDQRREDASIHWAGIQSGIQDTLARARRAGDGIFSQETIGARCSNSTKANQAVRELLVTNLAA